MKAVVHMRRSEDSFRESVLSSYHVGALNTLASGFAAIPLWVIFVFKQNSGLRFTSPKPHYFDSCGEKAGCAGVRGESGTRTHVGGSCHAPVGKH